MAVIASVTWLATSASAADTNVAAELDSRCICGSVEEIAELILCGSQDRQSR